MKNQIYLKSIVSHVTAALLPVAVLKHSFFINDVSPELQLFADAEKIAAAVKRIVLNEIVQTTDACIRISATVENDLLQLTIHKKGPFALPLTEP